MIDYLVKHTSSIAVDWQLRDVSKYCFDDAKYIHSQWVQLRHFIFVFWNGFKPAAVGDIDKAKMYKCIQVTARKWYSCIIFNSKRSLVHSDLITSSFASHARWCCTNYEICQMSLLIGWSTTIDEYFQLRPAHRKVSLHIIMSIFNILHFISLPEVNIGPHLVTWGPISSFYVPPLKSLPAQHPSSKINSYFASL